MIVPIPYVHAGMGLLCIILSLPLILKRIPMNHAFGIRVQKAFISQQNWYAINAFGGKLILGFGLFLLGFSYLSKDLAPSPTSIWAPVFLITPLVIIIPIAIFINAFARRLPDC